MSHNCDHDQIPTKKNNLPNLAPANNCLSSSTTKTTLNNSNVKLGGKPTMTNVPQGMDSLLNQVADGHDSLGNHSQSERQVHEIDNASTKASGDGPSVSELLPRSPDSLSPEELRMCELILNIGNVSKRDVALHELSKKRESLPNLACYLWFSFGTVAAFIQEIIAVYPQLHPPTLSAPQSHRVCNCLALLQCIASHPEIKRLCLRAHIPLYLYPFLNSIGNNRALEFLRLTALGVVGALVKGDDIDVLRFLLQSEIVPLCLRIMDSGSELSQTVATFIVQKVLSYDEGLAYLCATAERFYAVSSVLSTMLCNSQDPPSARLLKHIVRCYLRLCENRRAREAFRHCLPSIFWTEAFSPQIEQDPAIQKWISHLLAAVSHPTNTSSNSGTTQNDSKPPNISARRPGPQSANNAPIDQTNSNDNGTKQLASATAAQNSANAETSEGTMRNREEESTTATVAE